MDFLTEKEVLWVFWGTYPTRTLKARANWSFFTEVKEEKRGILLGCNESHSKFPDAKLFCFPVLIEFTVLVCLGS